MDRRRMDGLVARALDQFERDLVVDALRYTGGNESAAARILGMSRITVRKIRRAAGEDAWKRDEYRTRFPGVPWATERRAEKLG